MHFKRKERDFELTKKLLYVRDVDFHNSIMSGLCDNK